MAHELTQREDGFVEFAFTGNRSKIWHSLGQELSENTSIEQWKKEAGMDWEIFTSGVNFHYVDNYGQIQTGIFPNKKALFRSDNKKPLAIVGDKFKIVQPEQVLEFFRDLVENNGMKLSAAGTLFGGTKFWATAELGKSNNIVQDDKIEGFLLLTTSCDGSLATTAKVTSTRVVCNNTLSVAMNQTSKNIIKVSHKSEWDAKQVKVDLGLIDESWENFIKNCRNLSNAKVNNVDARSIIEKICLGDKDLEDAKWGHIKKVQEINHLYHNGLGNEYSYGTLWGVLNAFTEYGTYGKSTTKQRDESTRFWDSAFGNLDKLKNDAYSSLLELA